MAAYDWILTRHNDVQCQCDYCLNLRPYVQAKRDLHRHKRQMDSHWYDDNPVSVYADEEKLHYLKRKVSHIKEHKDALKRPTISVPIVTVDDNGAVTFQGYSTI